jgi:hypothetical protein
MLQLENQTIETKIYIFIYFSSILLILILAPYDDYKNEFPEYSNPEYIYYLCIRIMIAVFVLINVIIGFFSTNPQNIVQIILLVIFIISYPFSYIDKQIQNSNYTAKQIKNLNFTAIKVSFFSIFASVVMTLIIDFNRHNLTWINITCVLLILLILVIWLLSLYYDDQKYGGYDDEQVGINDKHKCDNCPGYDMETGRP